MHGETNVRGVSMYAVIVVFSQILCKEVDDHGKFDGFLLVEYTIVQQMLLLAKVVQLLSSP